MKTVLYIIWALFVLGAAFSIVLVLRKSRRQERLTADWPRARATVTGSVAGWSNAASSSNATRIYYPAYQFTDARGILFAGGSEVSFASQPVPGSPLDVAYNPLNPNQSFQQSTREKTALGCIIPFFAVFAVASFLLIGIFPIG
ncbi:DUF3592 domain-containing protein [Micrococcaceae bacterium Sec5.7]